MSPRKLKRGALGQKVVCKTCLNEVPITKSRERLELLARSYSAAGTLTNVALLKHTAEYTCDRCVVLLEFNLDPKDYEGKSIESLQPEQVELFL